MGLGPGEANYFGRNMESAATMASIAIMYQRQEARAVGLLAGNLTQSRARRQVKSVRHEG